MTSGRVLVGFDQKVRVSGSGSGIVHIIVLRQILWSFFCNSTITMTSVSEYVTIAATQHIGINIVFL